MFERLQACRPILLTCRILSVKCHGMLWVLINKTYDQEKVPEGWRESILVTIYKVKGGKFKNVKTTGESS